MSSKSRKKSMRRKSQFQFRANENVYIIDGSNRGCQGVIQTGTCGQPKMNKGNYGVRVTQKDGSTKGFWISAKSLQHEHIKRRIQKGMYADVGKLFGQKSQFKFMAQDKVLITGGSNKGKKGTIQGDGKFVGSEVKPKVKTNSSGKVTSYGVDIIQPDGTTKGFWISRTQLEILKKAKSSKGVKRKKSMKKKPNSKPNSRRNSLRKKINGTITTTTTIPATTVPIAPPISNGTTTTVPISKIDDVSDDVSKLREEVMKQVKLQQKQQLQLQQSQQKERETKDELNVALDELTALKEKMDEKEEQFQQQKEELRSLRPKLIQNQRKIQEMDAQSEKMLHELEQQKKLNLQQAQRIRQQEQDLYQVRQQLESNFQPTLIQATGNVSEQIQLQISVEQRKNELLEKKLDSLRDQIEQLKSEQQEPQFDQQEDQESPLDQARQEVSELSNTVTSLQEQLEQQKEQLDQTQLQMEQQQLHDQLKLQEQIDKQNQLKKKKQNEINNLQEQIKQLQENQTKKEENYQKINEELNKLKTKQEKQQISNKKEIQSCRKELKQKEEYLCEKDKKIKKLEEQIHKKDTEVKNLQEKCKQSLSKGETDLGDLRKRFKNVQRSSQQNDIQRAGAAISIVIPAELRRLREQVKQLQAQQRKNIIQTKYGRRGGANKQVRELQNQVRRHEEHKHQQLMELQNLRQQVKAQELNASVKQQEQHDEFLKLQKNSNIQTGHLTDQLERLQQQVQYQQDALTEAAQLQGVVGLLIKQVEQEIGKKESNGNDSSDEDTGASEFLAIRNPNTGFVPLQTAESIATRAKMKEKDGSSEYFEVGDRVRVRDDGDTDEDWNFGVVTESGTHPKVLVDGSTMSMHWDQIEKPNANTPRTSQICISSFQDFVDGKLDTETTYAKLSEANKMAAPSKGKPSIPHGIRFPSLLEFAASHGIDVLREPLQLSKSHINAIWLYLSLYEIWLRESKFKLDRHHAPYAVKVINSVKYWQHEDHRNPDIALISALLLQTRWVERENRPQTFLGLRLLYMARNAYAIHTIIMKVLYSMFLTCRKYKQSAPANNSRKKANNMRLMWKAIKILLQFISCAVGYQKGLEEQLRHSTIDIINDIKQIIEPFRDGMSIGLECTLTSMMPLVSNGLELMSVSDKKKKKEIFHNVLNQKHFNIKTKQFPDDALLDFAKEFVHERFKFLLEQYVKQPQFQGLKHGKNYQLFHPGPLKLEKRIHEKMKSLILKKGPNKCDRFQAANNILDYVRGSITLPNPTMLIKVYEDFVNMRVNGFEVLQVENFFQPNKKIVDGMKGHRYLLLHCMMDLGQVCAGAHGRPPKKSVTLVKTDHFIVEVTLNLEHYLHCYKQSSKMHHINRVSKLSRFAQ